MNFLIENLPKTGQNGPVNKIVTMTYYMSEFQNTGERSSTGKCISREIYLLVSPYINIKGL